MSYLGLCFHSARKLLLSDKKLVFCFSRFGKGWLVQERLQTGREALTGILFAKTEFFYSPLGCIFYPEDNSGKYSTILVWVLLFQVWQPLCVLFLWVNLVSLVVLCLYQSLRITIIPFRFGQKCRWLPLKIMYNLYCCFSLLLFGLFWGFFCHDTISHITKLSL